MQVSRWTCCFILSLCLFALGCSGPPICLNGVIEGTEVCDDGNLLNGDGCDENCTSTGCGNGILTSPEVCDDGNLTNGDGCASSCAIEPGFACLGTPSVCALLCGNGLLNQGEICDDGNLLNLDGCASNCTLEEGFTCLGEPTVCAPICGDGLVRGDEPCDDGNATQNDGCDPDCSTSRAVQVSSGRTFTCVLLTGGDVRCWGQGIQGQLGYPGSFLIQGNSVGDDEIPAIMGNVDVGGVVTQLDAGGIHVCALLNTGAVRCWGDGSVGALGYGNTNSIGDNETPASAGDLRLFSSVERLESGGGFTCALGKLSDAGTVRCWGFGIFGRLGYGNTENIGDDEDLGFLTSVEVGGFVTQVAVGEVHSCALLETGEVRCWGLNDSGQLGYGNTENIGDDETPASVGVVEIGGVVSQLTAGFGYTCALLSTGQVRCWGVNQDGRLGYGNTENIGDDETPASAGNVPIF